MESESRQAHWQNVYTKKGENEVSWFQENPTLSLELISQVGATPASTIIDIGGVPHVWSTISLIGALKRSQFSIYRRPHWELPKPALGTVPTGLIGSSRTPRSGNHKRHTTFGMIERHSIS
jgi:hypothetical protein